MTAARSAGRRREEPGRFPARIISLIPSATEILFVLGAGDRVVGVTHECDFPPEARTRPILTASALPAGMAAQEVDRAVSAQLTGGESLYTLDEEKVAALAPDLVVTQELCPVCAVATAEVEQALRPLPRCPEVMSLDPRRLGDVLDDLRRVGARLGLEERASEVVAGLEARLARVRQAVAGRERPAVAALEWLDPPFAGGHWVPEMIDIAGGRDLLAAPGDRSSRITLERLAAADPDVIIVMPCGYDREGAAGELAATLARRPGWRRLRAVAERRCYPVDANGCFSRPGPRLVDGIEELARLLHPGAGVETPGSARAEGPPTSRP
jgi:iron complex transport system substrate-binding protein